MIVIILITIIVVILFFMVNPVVRDLFLGDGLHEARRLSCHRAAQALRGALGAHRVALRAAETPHRGAGVAPHGALVARGLRPPELRDHREAHPLEVLQGMVREHLRSGLQSGARPSELLLEHVFFADVLDASNWLPADTPVKLKLPSRGSEESFCHSSSEQIDIGCISYIYNIPMYIYIYVHIYIYVWATDLKAKSTRHLDLPSRQPAAEDGAAGAVAGAVAGAEPPVGVAGLHARGPAAEAGVEAGEGGGGAGDSG